MKGFNITHEAAPFKPRHPITEVHLNHPHKQLKNGSQKVAISPSDYVKVLKENPVAHTLIIEPSLEEVKRIAVALGSNWTVDTIYRGKTEYNKAAQIIVATQVVDAGVTLKFDDGKGVDLVIDSGDSIITRISKVKRIPSSKATSIQRRGRTGRSAPGLYIRMHNKHSEETSTPNALYMMNNTFISDRHYGHKLPEHVSELPPSVHKDIVRFLQPIDGLTQKEFISLAYFYYLLYTTNDGKTSKDKYQLSFNGIFSDEDKNVAENLGLNDPEVNGLLKCENLFILFNITRQKLIYQGKEVHYNFLNPNKAFAPEILIL